jgi:Regulator of chromosome condensation (RCC1) repeat
MFIKHASHLNCYSLLLVLPLLLYAVRDDVYALFVTYESRIQGIGSNTTVMGAASKGIVVDFGTGVLPIAISLGDRHACAITQSSGTTESRLYCWGWNKYGQLGTPTTDEVLDCFLCTCYALIHSCI